MVQIWLTRLYITLIVLAIIGAVYLMWALVWRALYYPIQKKDEIEKEREQKRKELLEIQAAISVEWDKYKEVEDERDRLRKAYFNEQERTAKLREQNAKAEEHNIKLTARNKELRAANQKLDKPDD